MRFKIRDTMTQEQIAEMFSHSVAGLIRQTTNEFIRAALVDAAMLVRDRLRPEEAE